MNTVLKGNLPVTVVIVPSPTGGFMAFLLGMSTSNGLRKKLNFPGEVGRAKKVDDVKQQVIEHLRIFGFTGEGVEFEERPSIFPAGHTIQREPMELTEG